MKTKFIVAVTKTFKDNFKKLSMEERTLVKRKIELLAENPYHPSLRSKRVRGENDCFESSVNMDIRVLWQYEDGKIILLLNIGHHDLLKRY